MSILIESVYIYIYIHKYAIHVYYFYVCLPAIHIKLSIQIVTSVYNIYLSIIVFD